MLQQIIQAVAAISFLVGLVLLFYLSRSPRPFDGQTWGEFQDFLRLHYRPKRRIQKKIFLVSVSVFILCYVLAIMLNS
jgi:hypothetical protein